MILSIIIIFIRPPSPSGLMSAKVWTYGNHWTWLDKGTVSPASLQLVVSPLCSRRHVLLRTTLLHVLFETGVLVYEYKRCWADVGKIQFVIHSCSFGFLQPCDWVHLSLRPTSSHRPWDVLGHKIQKTSLLATPSFVCCFVAVGFGLWLFGC